LTYICVWKSYKSSWCPVINCNIVGLIKNEAIDCKLDEVGLILNHTNIIVAGTNITSSREGGIVVECEFEFERSSRG